MFTIYIIVDFGRWDTRELAHLPENEMQEFQKYYQQFIHRTSLEGAAKNGQGIALVCDWDGFTLANYALRNGDYQFGLLHNLSSKLTTILITIFFAALKLALASFTAIVKFNQALKYCFMVNSKSSQVYYCFYIWKKHS